jgi:hypothetical protein
MSSSRAKGLNAKRFLDALDDCLVMSVGYLLYSYEGSLSTVWGQMSEVLAFWFVTTCILIGGISYFGGICCLHLPGERG